MTEQVRSSEAVGRAIAAAGVRQVFGVVGSGNFRMTNALISSGSRFTAARHELGAACMADACSRLTGEVTVTSVHQGGGLLNSLTGVMEASKAHSRLLVLAGDVARGDVRSNFAIDQDKAVEAAGAIAMRIDDAATAAVDAARAVHTCRAERRPVVLSVPVDIQDQMTRWDPSMAVAPLAEAPGSPPPSTVIEIVDLLAKSKRPVIIGGRGAHHAKHELRALAAAAGALLVATAGGRGIFVGDEWALDVMGGFSTPGAAELIADADLLLAFGAGLNRWTARGGSLTSGKPVVQVDDRAAAFGFHTPVDLAVAGDTAEVARAVIRETISRFPRGRQGYRTPQVHRTVQSVRYWSDQPITPHDSPGFIDPAELSVALDRLLPMERVVIPDGGNVNAYGGAFFRVPDEGGYVMDLASQSIGLGLANGIGAGVARPDRLPLVATGDGSFLMNVVELDTAVRLGLGILVLVYNDSAYGAEVHIFAGDEPMDTVRFPDTDIAAIARGYGCHAATVRSIQDLEPVLSWLEGPRKTPFVIDAKIEGFPSPLMAQSMH